MSQRAYDDFAGMLADRVENTAPLLPEERRNLLSAISYQNPGDIPGCLAELAETLQLEPDELQNDFDKFKKEREDMKGRISSPSISRSKASPFENRSDSGNSRRLVARHGEKLRFCHAMNRWLIWTGDHWQSDEDGAILQYARDAVQCIYKEAADMGDAKERKDHAAFALRSESERALRAMTSLARSEPEIPIRREVLDAQPFKLNLANGVLDLETGDLLPHDPTFYFSKILPWSFDPEEPAPRWMQFLDEITGGDESLQCYLQEIAGYCLTASTREQVFFIFWGDGRNGKSTFMKILLELLGPWAAQTPSDTFILKKGPGNHNDLARLFDKRLVAAIETDEGGRLAEGLIKGMAGSDRIAARQLYQEFFEYEPTYKVVLTTNHKPKIKGTDFAIWRRIRLVPFTWKIPDEKVDLDLEKKLRGEMSGILSWAVKGCFAWLNRGKLESPAKVKNAVKDYRHEQDLVQRFVDDCCSLGDDFSASVKTLYEKYQEWSKDGGEYYLSKNKFSRRLEEIGIRGMHTEKGKVFDGIKVNDPF